MPRPIQTEQKIIFPLQANIDGFLHVDCTRTLDQEGVTLLQADAGGDDETTTTTAQTAAPGEFAKLPKNQQQRRVTA